MKTNFNILFLSCFSILLKIFIPLYEQYLAKVMYLAKQITRLPNELEFIKLMVIWSNNSSFGPNVSVLPHIFHNNCIKFLNSVFLMEPRMY